MTSLHTPSRSQHPGEPPAPGETTEETPVPLAGSMPAPADRELAIRELAYAFFEARGCAAGHELDDWLQAEARLQEQAPPDSAAH